MRSRLLAGVVASGLALTACSSSSGNSTPPPAAPSTQVTSSSSAAVTTPAPVTSSSSSAPSGTAPTHDALTAIVVQQGDVPDGYAGQAPSSTDDDANQAKVVACVGSSAVNPADKIEEVHGNDFVKDPQTISSDATSFKSDAAVDALVAVLTDPKAGNCFDALLREQVASSGGKVDSSKVTITPGTNGGPSNVVAVLQGKITITAQGQQATLNVLEGFIKGRQLLATISTEAVNADVDVTAFQNAGSAVATRVAAA